MLTRRTRVAVQKWKTCNRGRVSRYRSRRRADVQQWTRWTRVAFRTPRLYRCLDLPVRLLALSLSLSLPHATPPLTSHHLLQSKPKQKTLSLSSAGHGQRWRSDLAGDGQRWRSDLAGMGPLQEGAVHLPAEPLRHLHGRPLERGNNGLLAPLLFPILPSFFNPIFAGSLVTINADL